jgi:superfamily II DNA or RNA helicase
MAKIEPLYAHQTRIIAEDKERCGLFLGTGGAKTRTALEMALGLTLVICPKQQKLDQTWEKNNAKFNCGVDLTVISKETFRRDWEKLPIYDTVIIDECHNNFGVLPEVRQRQGQSIPKTSQMFEATFLYLKRKPPIRLYLCSATPVSPANPMNLWAIATILGHKWDFMAFRSKYYTEIRVGQRRIWVAKRDQATKDRIAELIKNFGYTGSLNDFFDVPEQTHKEVKIELTEPQRRAMREITATEADPLVRRARLRTIENGVLYGKRVDEISEREDALVSETTLYPSKKIDYILERAIEFPKMLIFANYTAQIHEISRSLRDAGYHVLELTGKTKDRKGVIEEAEARQECIVVAQSSISSGYELPSYPCVIYASKSFRFVDYEQSLGRVLRSNALKKNLYIHLVVDGCDGDCHDAIMSGQDFQERLTINH